MLLVGTGLSPQAHVWADRYDGALDGTSLLVQFARPMIRPIQSACEDDKCRHNGHQPYEV